MGGGQGGRGWGQKGCERRGKRHAKRVIKGVKLTRHEETEMRKAWCEKDSMQGAEEQVE